MTTPVASRPARLDDLARIPVETSAWSDAFQATFGATHVVHSLQVGTGTDPLARATLVRDRARHGHLALPYLWEPGDLVVRDADARTALLGLLVRLKLPLTLSRVPHGSATPRALAQAARGGRGLLLQREAAGWPGLDLDPGEDPERHLNAGRRSDLRRARRRAERLGELTFDVLTPRPEEVPALVEEATRVEAASWKTAAGTALAVDAPRGEFFTRYLAEAAATGAARIAFARIDGRAVAMELGAVTGQRLWLLKIGFDDAFSSCSPGQLLLLEVLRYAASSGLEGVELMGTPEPWTRVWTRDVRPCVSLHYYPLRPSCLPVLVGDARRHLLQHAS